MASGSPDTWLGKYEETEFVLDDWVLCACFRGTIYINLLAAYSRAGPALRTDDSVRLASALLAASARHMAPTSSESLPNAPPSDVNASWDESTTPLHNAGNFACGTAPPGALKHWISDRTVALLKSLRNIPAGPEHDLVRRIIRRQVKVSVQADREVWWTQKAKEMEEAHKSGNARRLFQLIRATGPRKPPVSETIKDRNGVTISNKEERLDRWAEYFEQQLSRQPAGAHLEPTGDVEPWTVNVEPPTASEVYDCICSLKRHRASGPDDLPPALFKDGGEILSQRLSDLFACIWEKESVPDKSDSRRASVHHTNKVNGMTPLHWSELRGHDDISEYLLLHGADPSKPRLDGKKPSDLRLSVPLSYRPNYLNYPEFAYVSRDVCVVNSEQSVSSQKSDLVLLKMWTELAVRTSKSRRLERVDKSTENIPEISPTGCGTWDKHVGRTEYGVNVNIVIGIIRCRCYTVTHRPSIQFEFVFTQLSISFVTISRLGSPCTKTENIDQMEMARNSNDFIPATQQRVLVQYNVFHGRYIKQVIGSHQMPSPNGPVFRKADCVYVWQTSEQLRAETLGSIFMAGIFGDIIDVMHGNVMPIPHDAFLCQPVRQPSNRLSGPVFITQMPCNLTVKWKLKLSKSTHNTDKNHLSCRAEVNRNEFQIHAKLCTNFIAIEEASLI
ncbi:ATP-binding cassette transporter [Clonorchis sinensis]|uniref:ATP-binding cassette transporter n=1 Tax=Clonorchis sinensis TaxID=79923 RepID=G7Y8N6_CLOSI|nr:ATP-binding cassette transporter [Clonorchis sinensis]